MTLLRTMTEVATDPDTFAADEPANSMGSLHLTIRRKEFLAAFGKVASAAPARSPKAILVNVKLVASDDPAIGVTLAATDLECGIRHAVHGVTVLSPGAAVLPTARVSSILSSCRDAELDLSVEGDHIVIRSDTATFRLPSENPDYFPEVPGFDGDAWHEVAAADLRKLIRRTVMCVDLESTRYALSGCLAEFSDDALTLVATDGRRLAKMTAPAEAVGGANPPEKAAVIPARALKLIDKNLDDPDLTVQIVVVANGSAVLVRTSDRSVTIYTRLVEGRFPDYRSVFPDSSSAVKIPLDVAEFRQAMEQASIVTSEASRGVDLTFGSSKLTLDSQAADVGSSRIESAVSYEGRDIPITFDPRYVIEPLKVIDDDVALYISLVDHKNAAVLGTDDGYEVVIMPLCKDR